MRLFALLESGGYFFRSSQGKRLLLVARFLHVLWLVNNVFCNLLFVENSKNFNAYGRLNLFADRMALLELHSCFTPIFDMVRV